MWGLLHGPQQDLFDLEFRIPAVCADRVSAGLADIGIVPSFEVAKQGLQVIPGAGIACHGPVRSILLVSAKPASDVKDQLELPPRQFYQFYRAFGQMGFSRFPLFHIYFLLGYLLGEERCDSLAGSIRRRMGHTPRI